MEVPCCGGLQRAAQNALKASGKSIPWQVVTISRDGKILEKMNLDGDTFMDNWGFGDGNCGSPIHLEPRGMIRRNGAVITTNEKKPFIDVAGRCDLTLDGVIHDKICVMDFEMYEEGTISEQYLDREGQTVLWRRFIRDDWTIGRYGKKWSELLSGNEQITGNGQRCVRWYDCLCVRFGM